MGLDTSHDCWHGPYSQFMQWRSWLNFLIAHDRMKFWEDKWGRVAAKGHTDEALREAWALGLYADEANPLDVLMSHSDCDGEISAAICAPLADALQDLADRRMPPRGIYDEMRPATERFIAGLHRAAAAGEPVRFG